MNKEEAEIEIKRRNEEASKKFCPLIRAECNLNCVCYYSPQFIDINNYVNPKEGYVNGGYCRAYIFIGGG